MLIVEFVDLRLVTVCVPETVGRGNTIDSQSIEEEEDEHHRILVRTLCLFSLPKGAFFASCVCAVMLEMSIAQDTAAAIRAIITIMLRAIPA